MFKKSLYYLLILSFFLIIVEFISLGLSKLNLLKFNNSPYIYSDKKYINLDQYWTEEESWGAWHKKNITVKHKKSCFDVEYQTNDIGARDDNFKNQKYKKNMILIGDSFAEGYGLSKEDMFETFIEETAQINLLNFSSSKDFGILQYYLIYNNLAKKFNHDGLIFTLFPNNDFRDNDFEFFLDSGLAYSKGRLRYRPYFKKINNKFEIFYPEKSSKIEEETYSFLKNYFWFSNVLRSIRYFYLSKQIKLSKPKSAVSTDQNSKSHISNYYFATKDQQEASIFFLQKIISENSEKKIYIFVIPIYEDYLIIKENDYRKNIYWWKKLKNLDEKYSNFSFVDFYDHADENYKNFFFPNKCDGHWNKHGQKWAGKIMSNVIQN